VKDSAKKGGPSYRLAAFGGAYVEEPMAGIMGEAELGWLVRLEDHRLSVSTDYLHEPFSTKTFNFPEEDQTMGMLERRLVQPNHVLGGDLRWKAKWTKWLRSTLTYHADAWWPEFSRDNRWAMRLYPTLRFGKLKGWYGEVGGQLFYKKFPNYRVADRTIDQQGGEVNPTIGYKFGKIARVESGFAFRYTDYLDARYEEIDGAGQLLRSDTSKNYLSYTPWAQVRLKPGQGLSFRAKYSYQVQDSQFYDREMNGRAPTGLIEPKFMRSYYDFRRTRIAVGAEWDFRDRLHLELMSEAWVRKFDNYEARDVDNYWTGELRLDTSVEIGGEVGVRLLSFEALGMRHDLRFTAFASHLRRTSNMKREVSLATNFEVTRVFGGIELAGR
jgi:hypothetical protein